MYYLQQINIIIVLVAHSKQTHIKTGTISLYIFNIFLTVHLRIILLGNQLDAQFLL